jgi:hypothetical protein
MRHIWEYHSAKSIDPVVASRANGDFKAARSSEPAGIPKQASIRAGTLRSNRITTPPTSQMTASTRPPGPLDAVLNAPPNAFRKPSNVAHPRPSTDYFQELDRLVNSRSGNDGPRLVVLVGTAGVGKIALALRWLHDLPEDTASARLYANLGG